MTPSRLVPHRQSGAYLLEALIGILIFSLGVLGIVGLQAASLRTSSDAGLRAEAVFAANQLVGQMWADNEANLVPNYSSTIGTGQPYLDFAAQLKAVQMGAWYQDPDVVFDANPPSSTSQLVTISIKWKTCVTPGCNVQDVDIHNYTTSAVVGQNQ